MGARTAIVFFMTGNSPAGTTFSRLLTGLKFPFRNQINSIICSILGKIRRCMIALISLILAIVCQLTLFRIYRVKKLQFSHPSNKTINYNFIMAFLVRKVLGFLLLGLIPGFIIFSVYPVSPAQLGLSCLHGKYVGLLMGLPVVIVFINYFLSKRPGTINRYPEMRYIL